ncbi:MAG: hypothetical protein IPK26_25905 [Planctomycetes bacterium]|nr:hypothetical protein [Planctomycetota bacterium]
MTEALAAFAFVVSVAAIAFAVAASARSIATQQRLAEMAGASAAILTRIADDVMRLEVQVALLRQREQVEHHPETPSRN